MYLTIQEANFVCPACSARVTEVVVTAVNTMFTAPAQGMHEGVGHTAALAGVKWVVRCGTNRKLHPRDLVVDGAKRLLDGLLDGPQPPQRKASSGAR